MRYIHSEERLPIPDNGEHLEKEEKNLSLSLCLVFSLPSWLQSGRVCVWLWAGAWRKDSSYYS